MPNESHSTMELLPRFIARDAEEEIHALSTMLRLVLNELQSQQGQSVTYTLYSVEKCKVLLQEALDD